MIKTTQNNHRQEIDNMLRDYLQNPFQFYKDLFEAAKDANTPRPGQELASILSLAESVVNRWSRPRESDEEPSGTGSRSDAERIIMTFKHFGLEHCIVACQTLVNALQQLIDDKIEQRADLLVRTNPDFLKEQAMKENSDVVIAIGSNKLASEVLREISESQITNKLYVAVRRKQEMQEKRTA
jgi:hypothetical protein